MFGAAESIGKRQTWIDKCPKDVLEELLETRAAFLAGQCGVSARSLAKAIVDDLHANRGLRICSRDTIRIWLSGK